MSKPLEKLSSTGTPMHYTVGAIIKQNDKYLLIDRVKPPYGFAGPAGHIDEGENELTAIKREVQEEVGLTITKLELIATEELAWNWCAKGINCHYWYLYNCETTGEVSRNFRETKSVGWYSIEEIKKLKLEPVWKYWFEKLKII